MKHSYTGGSGTADTSPDIQDVMRVEFAQDRPEKLQ